MNYYIITGTSRGLGEAVASKLISPENYLFCISRSANESLIKQAEDMKCKVEYINADLNVIEGIETLMGRIFDVIGKSEVHSIHLINNAGVLGPIEPVGLSSSNEIIKNVNVNLIAPMLLTHSFISHTNKYKVEKRVINISSGAGTHPYFGWSSYCSTKAGLDLFTQCTGLEQSNNTESPVTICSIHPGVIDTEMQVEIRNTDKNNFMDLEQFIAYKEEGILQTPESVAEVVIKLLEADKESIQGKVLDIKQFR
jgi:benzil reductase ((S)-benzoin forming)